MVANHSHSAQLICELQDRIRQLESTESKLRHQLAQYGHSEQELTSALQKVQVSLETAEVGLWILDLRTHRVWYSREWKRQLGYDEEEIGDGVDEWQQRVHPDDLPRVRALTDRYFANPIGTHESEFRMRHRDGSWRWMLSRAQLVIDGQGQPAQFAGGHFDITERRAARQNLIQERDLSQQIIDSLPGVFYLFDDSGRFLHWNDDLERVTGYSAHEVAQLHPLDLFRGESRAVVAQRISQVFALGEDSVEADLVSKDGVARPYYFTGKRIRFDGRACLIGMGIDITQRKLTEAALLASQQKYANLVNDLSGIVWEADPTTMRFTFVSDFAESLLGYPLAEWYEPDFLQHHLHAEDREATLRFFLDHTEPGAAGDIEYRMLAKDGSIVWLRDLVSVETDHGRPLRLRGVKTDITQRKLSEQARAEFEARVQQTQKMEALGTLAGGIAHDFNNLLTAIMGNAHLAREEARTAHASTESLEEILRAAHRAKDLVQRILTFSRPTEQQLRPLNIATTVQEAVRLLRSTLPAGLDLTLHAEPSLPSVRADASQIHQVVLNLATNAWHAMKGRSGRIDVSLERCAIEERNAAVDLPPGEYVCIRVRDTGEGMSEETLARIFEPFFTSKSPGTGTGLGLSVVHGIVRSHGGAIRVRSSLGNGSTFQVYLPASSAPPSVQPEETGNRYERGQGQHILYIDDEDALVSLMQRLLEKCGYRMTGCTCPTEALRRFREQPGAFDLVVTDSNMPHMSGLELAAELLLINPKTRIVLTSGYLRPDEVLRAREAGVSAVVLKPNTMDELVTHLHRLLQ